MSFKRPVLLVIIPALIIGMAMPAVAQTGAVAPARADSRTLRMRVADVDTRTLPNLAEEMPASFAPGQPYVIQLDGPLTPQKRLELRRAGVGLGDYLPDHAYVARMDNASPRAVTDTGVVRWVGAYRREWKIDPEIGQRLVAFETPERMLTEAIGEVQLVVTLFEGRDLEAAKEAASFAGAEILGGTMDRERGIIDCVIDAERVGDLADIAAVQFIEEAPELTFRNDTTYWIGQSNQNGQAPIWDQGIYGQGQIGGIIDGPVKESHCSFDDSVSPGPNHRKLVYYAGSIGSDSHGTHVAGTMAGDQEPYNEASYRDGMAFGAKMTFIPVSPIYASPSSFINRLQDAYDNGARIHSNSWGDDGTTSYTTWSRQIDQFSRDYEDAVVAFAVTNLSLLKTPENAKNVLAVGATQDTPNQDNHCTGGTGPTADGRRKPEIYLPGCSTNSSSYITDCGWRASTGTSMACPAVSGMGLLARQYYTDGFYPSGIATPADGFTPSGALLRATLINGAVDMTGVSGYPSNQEGWGRLLLDNSLYFPGDDRVLYVEDVWNAAGFTTGEQAEHVVQVVDNVVPLRVTLAWTDVPASVGSSSPAVNNLDLVVEGPGGVIYRGNVFNTSAGESITGGSADVKNNIEQVHLHVPTLGEYIVRVNATAVNQDTQGYALVVTGGIELTPPDCNENGIPDAEDIAGGTSEDCDGNGRPDECQSDCDGDDTPDACEAAGDCNVNGIPDDCDLQFGTSTDCNVNGVPDECDVVAGTSADCNDNGAPDECDVSEGTSADCDGTGAPDECEIAVGTAPDCNDNLVPDMCDIEAGTSEDCNSNGVPDACDLVPTFLMASDPLTPFHRDAPQSYTLVSPPSAVGDVNIQFEAIADLNVSSEAVDVDINGTYIATLFVVGEQCPLVADVDAIVLAAADFNFFAATGTVSINIVPSIGVNDLCENGYVAVSVEYPSSSADDCNSNGVPDECEADCNENGTPDDCDIAEGTSVDENGNGVPDECDVPRGDGDCDEDGDVDLMDFATFAICYTGGMPVRTEECLCADFNGDMDVDLHDFASFAGQYGRGAGWNP